MWHNPLLTELKIEGCHFKVGDRVHIIDDLVKKYPKWMGYSYLSGQCGTICEIYGNTNIRIKLDKYFDKLCEPNGTVCIMWRAVKHITDDIIDF